MRGVSNKKRWTSTEHCPSTFMEAVEFLTLRSTGWLPGWSITLVLPNLDRLFFPVYKAAVVLIMLCVICANKSIRYILRLRSPTIQQKHPWTSPLPSASAVPVCGYLTHHGKLQRIAESIRTPRTERRGFQKAILDYSQMPAWVARNARALTEPSGQSARNR